MFNDYFSTVVTDLNVNSNNQNGEIDVETDFIDAVFAKPKFELKPINEKEVEKVIQSLKNKHSSGHDEIPVTVIKAVKTSISKILCHLINSSFVSGIFPNKLKQAKIIPLHKKNDPENISNYRPVSVLPSISKVYEKSVHLQLSEFLEKFNILDDNQHGFRNGRSVVSAAVSFIESVIESVDKGKYTAGICMDLSKAFDSVKHSKLLEKLHVIGISKRALNWFSSYLTNRSQSVEITHLTNHNRIIKSSSAYQPIKFGVPQGSILGPLLFLCYLRGIEDTLTYRQNSKLCLYADDSNLIMSSNSPEETEILTFVELNNIGNYFHNHNLLLNSQKTKFINFKTARNKITTEPIITYNSFNIEKENQINFLGLTVDENLNWNEHVQKILIKINSGIFALSKMSFYCNLETLKSIYFAHVHSHLLFGIALYGSTKKLNMDNILKQQKRAIRIMLKLKRDDSAREHFKKLKIFTVFGQYIFETILIAKKQELEAKSIPLFHSYNFRRRNEIVQPHRLKFFEKKPSYAGNIFLKCVPENIKKENDWSKFKKMLKEYIINLAVYSLDEFSTSHS
uniref:Reverse transcriptase domain-containing protein n=1 Tax=Homalodisca liturata TaxID=320908 RepID=A0A1B6H9V6_9HEMI